MSKSKGLLNHYQRLLILAAVLGVIVYFMVHNIGAFGRALIVVIGFGAVVLIHEFGHFVVAKLSDIHVEAFSIGFPPILLGILRTEKGWRIRIMPGLFPKEAEDDDGAGLLSFHIGRKAKAGETEYRIGLIPFGGFVKMLGQEDTKTVEASDDPRSYANKSVGARMAVIAAGVTFNAISAIIAFMVVFLIGINRIPPIVGGVMADSPAARAGLANGDEIIVIGERRGNLEFSDIGMAAALSGRDEAVSLTVKHPDDSVGEVSLVAEKLDSSDLDLRIFGELPASSLQVEEVTYSNGLFERTGLMGGDRIISVGSKDIEAHWQLEKEVSGRLANMVTVGVERISKSGKKEIKEIIKTQVPLEMSYADGYTEVKSESNLSHIYSMVPRLKVSFILSKKDGGGDKLVSDKLKVGDIILAAGDIENPTFKEFRDVTISHEDKELAITLLRTNAEGLEETVAVNVTPKKSEGSNRASVGIFIALDAEHAVVAKTIDVEGGPEKLRIPRGATITAVDGVAVSSFYDCIGEIRKNAGQRITIDYRIDEEIAGDVAIDVEASGKFVTVRKSLAKWIPFELLERLYKADGPVEAIQMGYRRTVMFIAQAYITLQRAVTGLVSPKNFMGPVGIIAVSYKIVSQRPLIDYVHLLGLISAFIAVFNFLPILPFDGGHIVFLAVEKIKGSPVNEHIQGMVSYIGLSLVCALFLYVTFYDVVRNCFQ